MTDGPPLPADLWGSLPPEAQALILAMRAEVTELRAKFREQQRRAYLDPRPRRPAARSGHAAWRVTFLFFDRQLYIIFQPCILKVCLQLAPVRTPTRRLG